MELKTKASTQNHLSCDGKGAKKGKFNCIYFGNVKVQTWKHNTCTCPKLRFEKLTSLSIMSSDYGNSNPMKSSMRDFFIPSLRNQVTEKVADLNSRNPLNMLYNDRLLAGCTCELRK